MADTQCMTEMIESLWGYLTKFDRLLNNLRIKHHYIGEMFRYRLTTDNGVQNISIEH